MGQKTSWQWKRPERAQYTQNNTANIYRRTEKQRKIAGGEELDKGPDVSSGDTVASRSQSGVFNLGFVVSPSGCSSYSHRLADYRNGKRIVRPATSHEVEMWNAIQNAVDDAVEFKRNGRATP